MAITQPIARARLNKIYSLAKRANIGNSTVITSNRLVWATRDKKMYLPLYVSNKKIPQYEHFVNVSISLTGRVAVRSLPVTLKRIKMKFSDRIKSADIKPIQMSVKSVKMALTNAAQQVNYDAGLYRDNTLRGTALPGFAKTKKRKVVKRKAKTLTNSQVLNSLFGKPKTKTKKTHFYG